MRNITLTEGEYYHLYNRGVDKRTVFTTPAEYKRFLAYLFLMNDIETRDYSYLLRRNSGGLASLIQEAKPPKNRLVAIGAYCLMPNHFHLYVTQLADGGISKFMQRVQTAYTMFFNQKHDRSGALFQGTFKAEHVADDVYAKYLFSYIHLNPAKLVDHEWKEFGSRDFKQVREFVRQYPYSSFREYAEKNHVLTDPSKFPDYFSTTRELDEHIDTWLEAKNSGGLASEII